jgi:spermidine/putrescine transport system ATP-binding protein
LFDQIKLALGGAQSQTAPKSREIDVTDTGFVDVKNVVKLFGQGSAAVRALDDVSVSIRQGEFFTLLGPSGCGKTTLLRLIAGFEGPSMGQIHLDGADITNTPPNLRPINTVFQNYALFPHLTVAQNIAFGLEMLGRPKSVVTATVARMLAMVKLEALANRKTAQLSGGQQQRVALARALAPQPKVLLLDEPLSALDFKLRKEMQTELKRLQLETGITFIFVTHDQEEALTMSDRIAVMSAGKIQQIGAPRDIYTRPVNRFVADFIGDINILPAKVDVGRAQIAGVDFALDYQGPSRDVSIAIRPEQLRLMPMGSKDSLPATVTRSVYFGTDSHIHMTLQDGTEMVARLQTDATQDSNFANGTEIAISFAPHALQVLED